MPDLLPTISCGRRFWEIFRCFAMLGCMKTKKLLNNFVPPIARLALGAVVISSFVGCADLDRYPSSSYGGFNDPYPSRYDRYDHHYDRRDSYDYERDAERARRERHRLEHEREELQEEQRHYEEQRYRDNTRRPPPVHLTPPPPRETCPPGFTPGGQRCSNEERKHGCKDIRMPGGLTCQHR